MPIILAPVNKELRVVRIAADEKTKKHLENLGINVNGNVVVLSSSGGSVVVMVKDGRIAPSRHAAYRALYDEIALLDPYRGKPKR